ncbi:MAG: hypothetical protein ACI3XZ_00150 [Butyricicoccus sp.]
MKCKPRKFIAILLTIAFCFSVEAPALAVTQLGTSIQTFSDGTKFETHITSDTSKKFIEYDDAGEVTSEATFETDGTVNVAILDNGKEVFKSVFNTETEEMKLYRKPSSSPDSAYWLFYETPTSVSSVTPTPRIWMTDYRHGACFEFDWYEYNDNSHELYINHQVAKAPANKFLKECNTFLENSIAADENTGAIVLDILGFIPGASTLANFGHIAYTGAVSGDSSAVIADALVTAALSIAGEVCKPATVVATLIDSVNLIMSFNNVHSAYNKVKQG